MVQYTEPRQFIWRNIQISFKLSSNTDFNIEIIPTLPKMYNVPLDENNKLETFRAALVFLAKVQRRNFHRECQKKISIAFSPINKEVKK